VIAFAVVRAAALGDLGTALELVALGCVDASLVQPDHVSNSIN
jgi:hypothetical protein